MAVINGTGLQFGAKNLAEEELLRPNNPQLTSIRPIVSPKLDTGVSSAAAASPAAAPAAGNAGFAAKGGAIGAGLGMALAQSDPKGEGTGSVLSTAATGAGIGSQGGPVGAAIGGVIGLGLGILGASAKKRQRQAAQNADAAKIMGQGMQQAGAALNGIKLKLGSADTSLRF